MIRQYRELGEVERGEAEQRAAFTPERLSEALAEGKLQPEELMDLAGRVAAAALRERGVDLAATHAALSAQWDDACASAGSEGCPVRRSGAYAKRCLALVSPAGRR